MGDYSSDFKVGRQGTQQSHMNHQNMMLHSDGGNSSTKLFLNNMTGMTSGDMINNKILQSHRDEKAGTGTTIFAMPPGSDPYMSFIDSDKFSPI